MALTRIEFIKHCRNNGWTSTSSANLETLVNEFWVLFQNYDGEIDAVRGEIVLDINWLFSAFFYNTWSGNIKEFSDMYKLFDHFFHEVVHGHLILKEFPLGKIGNFCKKMYDLGLKYRQRDQLQAQLNTFQGTNNQLKTEIAQKDQKITEIQNGLNSQLTTLRTEKEKEITELKSKNTADQTKITQLETEIKQLKTLQTNLSRTNDQLTRQVGELQFEIQTKNNQIAQLQDNYDNLVKELDKINDQLEIPEKPENQTVAEKIKFFNNWLTQSKKDKEDLRISLQKEQRVSQGVRTSLQSLEQKLKNESELNQEEINKLRETNRKLSGQITKLENNLKQEKIQVQNLQQAFQNKQKELEQTEDELQESDLSLTALKWVGGISALTIACFFIYKWIKSYWK